MKRRNFNLMLLAALPFSALAHTFSATQKSGKGFKIASGEGRYHGPIKLRGVNANILDVKVSGKDTNGELAIFEQTGLSPKKGTPLHVHHNQDEIFYVLEGTYHFQVGEDRHRLTPGDSIFLPRKVPHAWTQVSEKGKMIVTVQPAGKLENFFVTMAALKEEPSGELIAKIFADNDMQVVGPPLQID